MKKEMRYEAVVALYEGLILYEEKYRALESMGITLEYLDDVSEKMEEALEALLPHSYGFVESYLELFSVEDLFYLEERAEKDELESSTSFGGGVTVKFTDGEVLKRSKP